MPNLRQFIPFASRPAAPGELPLPAAAPSSFAFLLRLAAIILLVNACVGALTLQWLGENRRHQEEKAAVTIQNLSRVLEENVAGTFSEMDLSLLAAADEAERQLEAGGFDGRLLNAVIARVRARQLDIDGMRVADADGRLLYGDGTAAKTGATIVDREYYRRLRDDPSAGLVISEPVTGRISGKRVIILARRIDRPDGSFGGVVLASLALDYLEQTFQGLDVGRNGAIALRDSRLHLITRYPHANEAETVAPEFLEAVRKAPKSGSYVAVSPLDRIERVHAYRRISVQPYYVNVGLATADYLAEWRKEVAKSAALQALFSLLTLLFGGFIYSAWSRQMKAVEALVRQEAQLRAERNFNQQLINTAQAIVLVLDRDGNIVFFNRFMEELCGYPLAEMKGRSWFDHFLLAEQREPVRRAFDAALGATRTRGNINPVVARDGRVLFIEWYDDTLLGKDGAVTGVLAIGHDVSERRAATERLRRMNRLYSVLSKTNEMIVRVRDRHELFAESCRIPVEAGGFAMAWIGRVEPGAQQVVPYVWAGREEGYLASVRTIEVDAAQWSRSPIGRVTLGGISVVCADISADPAMCPWRDAASARGYRSCASFPIRENGKVIAVYTLFADEPSIFSQDVIQLIEDLSSDISFAVDFINHIQYRVEAEQQLRTLNESLEQRVEERTRQLESANREIESFSYSVSHDLRAPLRSIDGFSRVLLTRYADRLDEVGRNYLDRVCAATRRMGELIDDLLMLSRLGRAQLTRREIDLTAMARAVADALRESAPERQVEWVIEEGMQVHADPRLMRTLLENLLGNAWKFTSRRTVARIEVGTVPGAEKPAVFVRDNGAGFDMRYADKLFGAFQRLHAVDEFEGTGIGLATVQRIVNRHGGRIWAEGEVDRGATFYFMV